MREKGKIAASIMCSGFDQVMDYVHEFERNNIEFLHVDVMDGTFVPNLAYGPDFVKRLRKKTDITLDCHLMVDRAEDKLDWFDFQPGEHVSLHVNPGFAGQKIVPHTIEKAARIRKYLDDLGHPEVYIESDGNITCENAAKLYKNGSDIFVAGTSSIFREGDIDELIMNLRKAIGW